MSDSADGTSYRLSGHGSYDIRGGCDPSWEVTARASANAAATITVEPEGDERQGDPVYVQVDLNTEGSGRASLSPFGFSGVHLTRIGRPMSAHISFDDTLVANLRDGGDFRSSARVDVKILPDPNIVLSDLEWDATRGLEIRYSIHTNPLVRPALMAAYWSTSQDPDDAIGAPIATFPSKTSLTGPPHRHFLAWSHFSNRPVDAEYIVVVADPDGDVPEENENDNVSAISATPNITNVVLEKDSHLPQVNFGYDLNGLGPGAIDAALYWSSDDQYDPWDDHSVDVGILGSNGSVQVSALGKPPTGANYLVYAVDPYGAGDLLQKVGDIRETNENDNYGAIPIVEDPLVLFGTRSQPFKGVDYGIFALVHNRSLIPETFSIQVEYDPDDQPAMLDAKTPTEFDHDVVYDNTVTPVQFTAMERKEVDLQTVQDTWNWIPPENPVELFTSIVGGLAFDEVVKTIFEAVKRGSQKAAGGALTIIGLANSFKKAINPTVPNEPIFGITYKVNANNRSTGSEGTDEIHRKINVPRFRQLYFDDFIASYVAGSFALSGGISVAAVVPPPVGLGGVFLASYGLGRLLHARQVYENAVDPPDPNFEEIPQPILRDELLPEGIAEVPFPRALIEKPLTAFAFEKAAFTARNRADGALVAGEPSWQAAQVSAAAQLRTQAALAYAEYTGLLAAADRYLAEAVKSVGTESLESVLNSGFPPEIRSLIQDFGYTEEDISSATEWVAESDPPSADISGQIYISSILASVSLAASAVEELREATAIRIGKLGKPQTSVSPKLLSELATARQALTSRLEGWVPRGPLLKDIERHIDSLATALEATNDFHGLESELLSAFDLLPSYAAKTPGLEQLVDYIDQRASSGELPIETATQIRQNVAEAEAKLVEGDFPSASQRIIALIEVALESINAPASGDVVDSILGQILYLHDHWSGTSNGRSAEAVDDMTLSARNATTLIDVVGNDLNGLDLALQIEAVFDVEGGEAVIDDGGTPDDRSDDRVAFTLSPDGAEGSFYYVVAAADGSSYDVGHATVLPLLSANIVTQVQVPANQSNSLYFEGRAGDLIWFDDHDDDNIRPTRRLISPSEEIVEIRETPIALAHDGIHKMSWTNSTFNDSDQDAVVVMGRAEETKVLLPDNEYDLVISSNPHRWSRAVRRLGGKNGDRLVVSLGDSTMASVDVSVLQVDANGGLRSEWIGSGPGNYAVDLQTDIPVYLEFATWASENPVEVSVQVSPAPTITRTMTYGELVQEQVDNVNEVRHYNFNGSAGDRLMFDAIGSTSTPLAWSLTAPGGEHLKAERSPWNPTWHDSEIFELPIDGEYLLTVRTVNTALPEISFRLVDIATIAEVSMEASHTVTLGSGEAQLFRVPVPTAQSLAFISEAVSTDPTEPDLVETYWEILDLSFARPADSSFAHDFPEPGDFLLRFTNQPGDSGSIESNVTFRVQSPQVTTADATLGEKIHGRLSALEEKHYFIQLVAGQTILFQPIDHSGDEVFVVLSHPNDSSSLATSIDRTTPFQIRTSGLHQISVFGAEATAAGTFSFRLLDLTDSSEHLFIGDMLDIRLSTGESRVLSLAGEVGQRYVAEIVSGAMDGATWSAYDSRMKSLSYPQPTSTRLLTTADEHGPNFILLENTTDQAVDLAVIATEAPSHVQTLNFGASYFGEMTQFGESAEFTFNLSEEDLIVFDSLDSEGQKTVVELLDSGRDVVRTFKSDVDSDVFFAAQSGKYSVRIHGYGGANANYGFRILQLNTSPAVVFGESTVGNLPAAESGKSPSRQLVGYHFIARPGHLYRLSESAKGAMFVVPEIYDAIGNELSWRRDRVDNSWTIVVNADVTSPPYWLVVRSPDAQSSEPHEFPFEFVLAETPIFIPIARDDTTSLTEGNSVTIDLINNDAIDSDSRVEIVDSVSNGFLFSVGRGLYLYNPDLGFHGEDSFTYRIIGEHGQYSNVGHVNITVRPNLPPIAVDDTVASEPGAAVEIEFAANDSDADGSIDESSVEIVEAPQNGTVKYVATGSRVGHPLGDGYPAVRGQIGVTTELFVTGAHDYEYQGFHAQSGRYSLFVKFGATDFEGFQADDFDRRIDYELVAGQVDRFDISGWASFATPFIAWIDSGFGEGAPTTLLKEAHIGAMLYQPDGEFSGVDMFSYTVRDDLGATSERATVTIRVGNPGSIPGDLDADGLVGFSDFLILSANFGRDDEQVKSSDGDIDGDGRIQFSDFLILSANFG